MTTKKTVVVLGSYAPSLVMFRGSLIAELGRRGYAVVAMAPDIGEELGEQLRKLGAEPRNIDINNASMMPGAAPRSLAELKKAFREIRPHGVIAYTIKPVTLGCMAAASLAVPKITALITGIGFSFTPGRGFKRRLSRSAAAILYRRALKRAHSVIFQNPDDRRFFLESGMLTGREGVVVNGSGIDTERFSPAPVPSEPRFLMISRLLGDKGVREYAAAAAELKQRHPNARFDLVGYFDGSPDAIGEAELRSWQSSINFLGKLDDVRPALAAASVYVLPSYREGTPRSTLEALAMGRAVVTSDAPGCRETVVDGVNGFLVAPRDARALAQAMERFILDPELAARMGPQSRRIAETKYDVHMVNGQILAAAGL